MFNSVFWHINSSIFIEETNLSIRLKLFNLLNCVMIKRRENYSVEHIVFFCHSKDFLLDRIKYNTCLNLDINNLICWSKKLKYLSHCRNLSLLILRINNIAKLLLTRIPRISSVLVVIIEFFKLS